MSKRHLARSIVMQSLYQWDFRGNPTAAIPAIIDQNMKEFGIGLEDTKEFVETTVDGVIKHQKEIDIKLADAIEETVELFSNDPEWNQKIRVTAKMNKKLSVFIDPSHFAQILWNLLKNAAQSIKGHGEIKILLKPSLNNRVHLSIKDSGTGIHPKDYTHIFDPFYTSKPDGTGLGLSIIHRLIDTYNGVIHFESTPGKGTVFTVLFKGVPLKTK